jgi:hypothetical protein
VELVSMMMHKSLYVMMPQKFNVWDNTATNISSEKI